jgi:hypothetical protein
VEEPPISDTKETPAWLVAVVFIAVIALVAFPKGCSAYFSHRTQLAEDPYFRQAACLHESAPASVEITITGITSGCVGTYLASYRFVNRLTDYPVTLCLGQDGRCATGHYSPFPGGRLTLRPGESRKIHLPRGDHYAMFSVDRLYPITVTPVPGMTFINLDVVVRSRVSKPSGREVTAR